MHIAKLTVGVEEGEGEREAGGDIKMAMQRQMIILFLLLFFFFNCTKMQNSWKALEMLSRGLRGVEWGERGGYG